MGKLRQLLFRLFIFSTIFTGCALAQTGLTQILDTVYNADKSLFNGTVIVSWSGFTGPTGNTIAPHSTATQILNGVLSVFLVPTTTASSCAYYTATYNSSDGTVTWTETWLVPPSATALTLNQVRQPEDCDSTGGGGGGGGGDITIADVIGLASDLNAIDLSLTSFTNSLTTLTTTVAGNTNNISGLTISLANLTKIVDGLTTGSDAVFVDDETPAGTINGTNAAFTLANAPLPPSSLTIYSNGVLLGTAAYTLVGNAISFSSDSVPKTGDLLQAYYRLAGTGPSSKFSDDEVPSGTIDAKNLIFTLANAPNPPTNLRLYKNGVLLQENSDYTLSGMTITFLSISITPQPGDSLIAYYRY